MSIFGNAAGADVSHLAGGKISPEMANMVINTLGLDKNGGFSGLQEQFAKGGAGDIFQTWVGTGDNASISEGQMSEVIRKLPQMHDVNEDDLSKFTVLSVAFLPELINKATPSGELPSSNNEADMLKNALISMFAGGGS